MRLKLVWKLVIINLVTILIVVLVIDAALRGLAAAYFMTLVEQYNIAPDKAHRMFLAAVERYLFAGFAVASLISIALSFWLTRRALKPLLLIMEAARQIAAGNCAIQVDESVCGEMSELATTFNRMVESLIHIERLRKDMVINVAHELRTPLTNIRGYLEALMDYVIQPDQDVLASLHEETLRLVSLVEELLRQARTDAAGAFLRIETVRLDHMIEQNLQLFNLKFSSKQIHVEKNLAEAELEVRADSDKLAQVLINLFENAWRYTPPEGRVKVAAENLANSIRVTVSNTVENNLPRHSEIFDRFYRTAEAPSQVHGGAGLGLAIVKQLVESHGGSVGCKTNDGDIGIWFSWPKA